MKNKKSKTKKITKTQMKTKTIIEQPSQPFLRFSPTAWAKLLYFRDKTDNEVGGFGITQADDLLYVIDFVTVKQEVTAVSVKFDDNSVADFFDSQVDLGRKPEQFARHWLHTHPANFAEPSAIDEETFKRVFGSCQWAVMFILAEDNQTYARLSFNAGPGAQVQIPVRIDYSHEFGPSEKENWDTEYIANVTIDNWLSNFDDKDKKMVAAADLDSYALPYDFIEELEEMSPAERQVVLDELAGRPELWNEESEVMYL
jgi:hypothetical protein